MTMLTPGGCYMNLKIVEKILLILILYLKSVDSVYTSIETDYYAEHKIKLRFFSILSKITP